MDRQEAIDRTVSHWAALEQKMMPSFFHGMAQLDSYDLYRNALAILRDASFFTPHYMHGWAVGVEGRKFWPEKTLNFANEFETGYVTGWCQMDDAMKREEREGLYG